MSWAGLSGGLKSIWNGGKPTTSTSSSGAHDGLMGDGDALHLRGIKNRDLLPNMRTASSSPMPTAEGAFSKPAAAIKPTNDDNVNDPGVIPTSELTGATSIVAAIVTPPPKHQQRRQQRRDMTVRPPIQPTSSTDTLVSYASADTAAISLTPKPYYDTMPKRKKRTTTNQSATATNGTNPSSTLTLRRLQSVQASSGKRLQELQSHLRSLHDKQQHTKDDIATSQHKFKTLQTKRTEVLEGTLQQITERKNAWKGLHLRDCENDVVECRRRLDYLQDELDAAQRELQFEQRQQSFAASHLDDSTNLWSNWFSLCHAPHTTETMESLMQTSKEWELQLRDVKEEHRRLIERRDRVKQTIQYWDSQSRKQIKLIQSRQQNEMELDQKLRTLQQQTLPKLNNEIQQCQTNITTIEQAFEKCNALHTKYQQIKATEDAERTQRQLEELQQKYQQSQDDTEWWKDIATSMEQRMEQLEFSGIQLTNQLMELRQQLQNSTEQNENMQLRIQKLQQQLQSMESQKIVLRDLLRDEKLKNANKVNESMDTSALSSIEADDDDEKEIHEINIEAELLDDSSDSGSGSATTQPRGATAQQSPVRLSTHLRKLSSGMVDSASSVVSTSSTASAKVTALRQRMKALEGKKHAITTRLQQQQERTVGVQDQEQQIHEMKTINEQQTKTIQNVTSVLEEYLSSQNDKDDSMLQQLLMQLKESKNGEAMESDSKKEETEDETMDPQTKGIVSTES